MTGKIGSTLKEIFSGKFLYEDLAKFDEVSYNISRQILQGRDAAFGIRQAFTEANIEVAKMGGYIDDVYSIQEDVIKSTQRNLIIQDKEFYEKIYAATQLVGEGARTLLKTYKDIGVSTYDATQNIQIGVNKAREMGVNVNSVFDKITNNLSKINEYNFQNGVEGFSKMAAKATSLRVDMGTTFGFAEKVLNPEGAIEMANAFQRLGVGTSQLLDPLRLMDLSMNDPEELQNQLSKMTEQFTKFNSETQRFEILPGAKRMLKELAKDTGIGYDQLTKMGLSSAELSKKLSEIKFPEFANKDQQEMIANLSEMKGGQYVVQIQEKDDRGNLVMKERAISELKTEDMQKLIDSNKGEDMVTLAKESMNYQKTIDANVNTIRANVTGGAAQSVTAEKIMRGFKIITDASSKAITDDLVRAKNISTNIDNFSTGIMEVIRGNISVTDALDKFVKHINDETIPAIGKIPNAITEYILKDKDVKFAVLDEFIKKEDNTVKQKTKTNDLIISNQGIFQPSENDLIIAADQTKKNISITPKSMPEIIPQTTPLISTLLNNKENLNQQQNNVNGEITVKFEPLELKITSDGNMEQLKIELQRNPEIGQLIARNVQKVLSDSFKSELSVKSYSSKPQSIA